MLKGNRVGIGILCAVPAYFLGAFGGGLLLNLVSSNRHDRLMESSMTGAFVFGPLAAVVGFVVGALCAKRRSARVGVGPELVTAPTEAKRK